MKALVLIFVILNFIYANEEYVDLGIRGQMHEIKEKSFLTLLNEKAQAFNYKEWKKKTLEAIDKSLIIKSEIGNCKKNNQWIFDPTITIEEDIKMPYFNKILYKKGDRYNPLIENNINFRRYIFFINADDEKQLALAYKYSNAAQIITVKGNLLNLKKYSIPAAIYREKIEGKAFKINCLPTVYTQDGSTFKVNEYKLDDK
jgi:hypothetical protein